MVAMDEQERRQRLAALRWQVEAGADEALAAAPLNRFAAAPPPAGTRAPVAPQTAPPQDPPPAISPAADPPQAAVS
ncbi:MAG: hypothetical protein ACPGVX_05600, partial [Thalassobaculaceae bacterium]